MHIMIKNFSLVRQTELETAMKRLQEDTMPEKMDDRRFSVLMNALADSVADAADQDIIEESEGRSASHTRAVLLEGLNKHRRSKHWYPASGGTEKPFRTRSGRRLLYCWQPSTGKHAYLDLDTDIILTDQEAWEVLGK